MNLDSAILAHFEWKNKFKAAISHQSQLDAVTIGRDDYCEFGKWLHGEGGKLYGAKPEFIALLEKHQIFHTEAGKVAVLINARNFDEATRLIETSSPFGAASLAVGVAVNALKRVV
jgi:methyl-accepting chemotaxis protein